MYYPCSENKDADQLRGYREADLRLCFRPCKLLVFSRTGSCPVATRMDIMKQLFSCLMVVWLLATRISNVFTVLFRLLKGSRNYDRPPWAFDVK